MEPIRQAIVIPFGYSVHFTAGVFDPSNPLLASVVGQPADGLPLKLLAVVDGGLCAAHAGLPARIQAYCLAYGLHLARPPLVVPGGEAVKNTDRYVHEVHAAISEEGLCRHSFVIAIGGGAVLDMAGFAAATAHRGIRLIRVPTTVLAQNDSGVGVKNGINAFGKKNFLGVFAPPCAVVNDCEFLRSLDDRDWRAGTAEAVKVALVKDADFFALLEQQAAALARRDLAAMQTLIYRCATLHVRHIANGGDPFETGSSRPLDFGHWAAHKLEELTHFRLRHGEAVAIGMALDATYAHLAGLLPEPDWRRIIALLRALGFELWVPELQGPRRREDPASLLHGLVEFREHLGGELTILLPQSLGRMVEVHEVNDELVAAGIGVLAEIAAGRRGFHAHRSNAYETDMSDEHAPGRGRVLHREPRPGARHRRLPGSA